MGATLVVPEGFSTSLQPIEIDTLGKYGVSDNSFSIATMQAGQSIGGIKFRFTAPEGSVKEAPVKILVTYEDALGPHYLEKEFSVEVGDRSGLIIILIAAIVVLVGISLYMKLTAKKSN